MHGGENCKHNGIENYCGNELVIAMTLILQCKYNDSSDDGETKVYIQWQLYCDNGRHKCGCSRSHEIKNYKDETI